MARGNVDIRSWLSGHYDQLLLTLALAALLGSVVFLLLRISGETQDLKEGTWGLQPAGAAQVEPLNLAEQEALAAEIGQPFQAGQEGNLLLDSERRVTCVNPECARPIRWEADPCPHCQYNQPPVDPGKKDDDGDGLTNEEEKKHGLDPNDPNDLYYDPDGDGFNNITEINAGTDHNDATSYPEPKHLLRLVKAKWQPFKMTFEAVSLLPGDKYEFQINMRTSSRTYFVGLGEQVEGYVVESYDENVPEGPTITLVKGGEKVKLVRGKVTVDKTWKAALMYLQELRPIGVRSGSTFQILQNNYKVIDIKPDQVIILDTISEEKTTIPRLTPDEYDEWKGRLEGQAGEAAAPSAGKGRVSP